MANVTGQVTFDQVQLIEVDSDPSTGIGATGASVGSIAVLGTNAGASMWLMYGAAATNWRRVFAAEDSSVLTSGSVPYINANGNIAQDNANFFWDATNKRLGIGLAAPQARLQIKHAADSDVGQLITLTATPTGNVYQVNNVGNNPVAQLTAVLNWQIGAGTVALPSHSFIADTASGLYSIGTSIVGIATAATERVRVDATGKVGIGKIPTTLLDVNGTGTFTDLFIGTNEVATRTQNTVSVKKNPGPGEFSSIAAAVASVTTATSSNPFVVNVGPGVYSESTITMKEYVTVIGDSSWTTIVNPSAGSQHVFVGARFSTIRSMTISGTTGTDFAAVYVKFPTGATSNNRTEIVDIIFGANDTHVLAEADTAPTGVQVISCFFGGVYSFDKGFTARNINSNTNGAKIVLRNCSTTSTTAPQPSYVAYATGTNCEIVMNSVQMRAGALTTTPCILVDNGARARLLAVNVRNFGKAVWAQNVGTPGPTLFVDAITCENCTTDLMIDHALTTGAIAGVMDITKVTINASVGTNVSIALTDSGTLTGLGAAVFGQEVVRQFSGQSIDMHQWQGSTGTPLVSINSAGILIGTNAIRVGNSVDTTAGNIRYSGTDIEGYVNGQWNSLSNLAYNVSSTSTATTTSATDAVLTGMSITPTQAGTYLVLFSASAQSSVTTGAGATTTFSCYANGVLNANSVRPVGSLVDFTGGSFPVSVNVIAIVTIAASQAIDIRWKRSAATSSCFQRTLVIRRIGP